MRSNMKTFYNKARYTATPVACEWAGTSIEVTRSFGQEQWGQKPQKPQKSKVWPTDGRTDGPTKRGVESRSTRLKSQKIESNQSFITRTISIIPAWNTTPLYKDKKNLKSNSIPDTAYPASLPVLNIQAAWNIWGISTTGDLWPLENEMCTLSSHFYVRQITSYLSFRRFIKVDSEYRHAHEKPWLSTIVEVLTFLVLKCIRSQRFGDIPIWCAIPNQFFPHRLPLWDPKQG